jgi:hypothetical protein
MFNKVTSRSYGYVLKFSYFFLVKKWISPTRSETVDLVKKLEGILGVNMWGNDKNEMMFFYFQP